MMAARGLYTRVASFDTQPEWSIKIEAQPVDHKPKRCLYSVCRARCTLRCMQCLAHSDYKVHRLAFLTEYYTTSASVVLDIVINAPFVLSHKDYSVV